MRIQARAKINWTLDITGRRSDGYHYMDMLMQPLRLSDELTMEPADELSLQIEGADGLSAGEDNLILRAAKALKEAAGIAKGASIRLQKNIPMGAGLGGGSADAAAALKGLNQLWETHFSLDSLCALGEKLGADIPFCLHDAPRRAQGIGELLSPIACGRLFPLVLVQPCAALSTRDVFSAYHQSSHILAPDTRRAMEALKAGDLRALRQSAGNVLESASIPMRPQIAEAKEALYSAGAAFSQMTGSGSVVFGAFETWHGAKIAWERLKEKYAVCLLTETAA